MDIDYGDIEIKTEEIEIIDIKLEQEEEEELEDEKPFLGFDQHDIDIKVHEAYKELNNLEVVAECISDVGANFDTATNASCGVNSSKTIKKRISILKDTKRLKLFKKTLLAHCKERSSKFTYLSINRKTQAMAKRKKLVKRRVKTKKQRNNKRLSFNRKSENLSNNIQSNKSFEQSNILSDEKSSLIAKNPSNGVEIICENDLVDKSMNNAEVHEMRYTCEYCDFQCNLANTFGNHQRRHSVRHRFSCQICSFSTTLKASLIRHVQNLHDRSPNISCTLCDFKCLNRKALSNHMIIHSGKNYFKCSDCDYKSLKQAVVRRHMVKHLKDKVQLSCSVCSYRGVRPEYLKKHMLKHHSFDLTIQNSFDDTGKENVDSNSYAEMNNYLNRNETIRILVNNPDKAVLLKKQPVVLLKRCDENSCTFSNERVNLAKIHELTLRENFVDIASCESSQSNDLENDDPETEPRQKDSPILLKSTIITKNKNSITSIVKLSTNEKLVKPHLYCVRKSVSRNKNNVKNQLQLAQGSSLVQNESQFVTINEVIYR